MNVLAIDYGTKNIGLAWVDTDLGVVLPYGNIENKNWKLEIEKLIKNERIESVIIGLPLTLEDGTENFNTKRVRKFGDELKKSVNLPVEFIDERLSSIEADNMGGEASRDEKSAMIILQSYLNSK